MKITLAELLDMTRKKTDILKVLIRNILPVLIMFSGFTYCARPAMPQGGPRDTVPPAMISAAPPPGSTNFTGKRITINFNEFIKLKDQQKEFFVSPFTEIPPNLTVKGKSLQVDFRDTLRSDQTYALNFGSSVVDNNEGNPLIGFRFVFSTGSAIDSLMMSAYTVDAYSKDSIGNVFLMFFEDGENITPEYDSTIFNSRPLAVSRSFPNGVGITENLKPASYRIYALLDVNNNQKYEPGADKVGFIDSLFNPASMPPFDTWYDELRMYWQAEPQLLFRLFSEEPIRRMTYTGSTRSQKGKIEINFSAPHPIIERITLQDIDSSRIHTEFLSQNRDSMILWIDRPQTLPDTIPAEILYHRHDSVNVLYLDTLKLKFTWRDPSVTTGRGRNGNGPVQDTAVKPLVLSISPGRDLNPQQPVKFNFEYPLTRVGTSVFELSEIINENSISPVQFSLVQDSLRIREWQLKADWKPATEYKLFIPPGALENVMGEVNDSILINLRTLNPDDFGRVIVNINGKTPESRYIIQLMTGNRIIGEKSGLTSGTYEFDYVPAGEARMRIVEDSNGNGRWDAGNLVQRIQPERVEMFLTNNGAETFTVRIGWELSYNLDMNEIFSPVTMKDMKAILERRDVEFRQYHEQQMLKRAMERSRNTGTQQPSSFGNSVGNTGSSMFNPLR